MFILSSLFGIGRAFAQNLNSHSPRTWSAVHCVEVEEYETFANLLQFPN
jgi:hypothetical protein